MIDGNEDNDGESLQIVDLKPANGFRHGRFTAVISAAGRVWARPWQRYALIGSLGLLLLLVVFLDYGQALIGISATHTVSVTPLTITLTPTPLSVAALSLLQRPLHLPQSAAGATCPLTHEKHIEPQLGVAQGTGPVYAIFGAETAASSPVLHYIKPARFSTDSHSLANWGGQLVLWSVDAIYRGPILVRGRQVDGYHQLAFGDAQSFSQHLMLDTTNNSGASVFFTYTRLQTPGCYAYQIDGTNFSETIAFQAVEQP